MQSGSQTNKDGHATISRPQLRRVTWASALPTPPSDHGSGDARTKAIHLQSSAFLHPRQNEGCVAWVLSRYHSIMAASAGSELRMTLFIARSSST